MDSSSKAPLSAPSQQGHPSAQLGRVMYTNAVYFHSGHIAKDETPAKLDYGCINLVYYAYARIAPDGIVNLGDEWADIRAPVDGVEGGLGSLMHLKQQHRHLKVILSIGGPAASNIFPSIASNPGTRQNFAHTAAGLVKASGLDGIDISWQVPADPVQGANFLALAQAVRWKLDDPGFLLTAALPASPAVMQHIDLQSAAQLLDFVNLETYSLHHSQPGHSMSPSQLYSMVKDEPSTSTTAGYVLSRNFPAHRLLLGIPTFGTSFPGCDGPGQAYDAASSQLIDYVQLPIGGGQEGVDRRRIAAYCTGGAGFIAYDNPDTVKEKAEFCKQKGFGGLFYSDASTDSKESPRSLVRAGFTTLHSS